MPTRRGALLRRVRGPARRRPTVLLLVVALLALISIVSIWLTFRRRRTPLWLAAIYIAVLLVAFLAWAASSAPSPSAGPTS